MLLSYDLYLDLVLYSMLSRTVVEISSENNFICILVLYQISCERLIIFEHINNKLTYLG